MALEQLNQMALLVERNWCAAWASLGGVQAQPSTIVDDQPNALPVAPMPAPGANAPPPPVHNGRAYWVKVSAREDGSFTVINTRNGFTREYR